MMTIEEMIKRKRELGYSFKMIAELSELPLGTVQKVLGGYVRSPRKSTVDALERVLSEDNKRKALYVRETPSSYVFGTGAYDELDAEYTLDDFYAFPEGERVELIDGRIYSLSAPSAVHQLIVGMLYNILTSFIRSRGGSCVTFVSPIDVRIKCDDRNMVEPDLIVVFDRDKITPKRIEGAPDLVIEVLSPSSVKVDNNIKRNLYREAGVREYWIVDPMSELVYVQRFDGEKPGKISGRDSSRASAEIYSFDDKVETYIFESPCGIDFSVIREELEKIF